MVPIVFSQCFSLYYKIAPMYVCRQYRGMSFVERAGKPQNWSAIGCDGLTPWSAGAGSMVPAPTAAVLSAAAWPRSPGRGRILRWAGSSSESPYEKIQVVSPYPLLCPHQLLPGGRGGNRSDTIVDGRGCRGGRFRGRCYDGGGAQDHLQCQHPSRHPRRRQHTAVGPLKDERHRWTQSAAVNIVLDPPPPTAAAATTRVSDARHLDNYMGHHLKKLQMPKNI